jgi:hypothetical protein
MNPTRQMVSGELLYTVVDDFTSVYRAAITGLITDEILGVLNAPGLTIEVDPDLLDAKIASGGAFAVTGYVGPSTNYTVTLTMKAAGFKDFKQSIPIPLNSVFPLPAPAIALRRAPVRLQGRVVSDTSSRAPIAGAEIVSLDDPNSPPPAVHPLALRSTLSVKHAAGIAIREMAMDLLGNATLQQDARAGTKTLTVSTQAGLLVGSVVRLSDAAGTRIVYAIATAVSGVGAGPVSLRDPLDTTFFAAGTTVEFLKPGAVGAVAALSADADAGDGVLLSSAPLAGGVLEIDPGAAAVEYANTGARTDADGYYAINGVGRARELFFQASHAGFSAKVLPLAVEYGNAVNVLNFRL